MNDMTNTNIEGNNNSFYEKLITISKMELEESRLDKERLAMYEKLKTIKEIKAYSAYFDKIKEVTKQVDDLRERELKLKNTVLKDIDDIYHKKFGDNYKAFGTGKEFWIYETGKMELEGTNVTFFDPKIHDSEREALDLILTASENTYLIRIRRPIGGKVIEYGLFDRNVNARSPYLQFRIF